MKLISFRTLKKICHHIIRDDKEQLICGKLAPDFWVKCCQKRCPIWKKLKKPDKLYYEIDEVLIAMYINDCMQYLKAKLKNKKVDLSKEEFSLSKKGNIINGLKELKDLCMKIAGRKPFNWRKK